jgi:hypothetical protein
MIGGGGLADVAAMSLAGQYGRTAGSDRAA